jgi:hypothetical protein
MSFKGNQRKFFFAAQDDKKKGINPMDKTKPKSIDLKIPQAPMKSLDFKPAKIKNPTAIPALPAMPKPAKFAKIKKFFK